MSVSAGGSFKSGVIEAKNKPTHAAEAPRISCRFAFVNRESTAEKTSVATNKIPIHEAFDSGLLRVLLIR